MSDPRHDQWEVDKAIARGILRNRQARRRFMANCAFAVLGILSIGLWVIDKWLTANPWMFIAWWGGCFLLTLFVILLAMYDIARVIREERDKQ